MRTIAVIGGNGQLGMDIVKVFSKTHDVLSLTHEDLDVSSHESVTNTLQRLQPEIVINTAALHHVEHCEREPEQAYAVNSLGARNLALVTRELDSVLMHISTDYVFDGRKETPYVENDAPLPLNVYGNTKLAGEYFVRSINRKHFVLRTSALYGQHPCRAKGGKNFVELMLKLGRERGEVRVVASETVSPTSTEDLAKQIVALSGSDAFGLYHATAEGSCSWHEFACEIFVAAGMKVRCNIAGVDEFPAKVARPAYSVLENAELKHIGLNRFQDWREGLHTYLVQICTTAS
jgi:dTDP-4-dehydrorhamnose reductase